MPCLGFPLFYFASSTQRCLAYPPQLPCLASSSRIALPRPPAVRCLPKAYVSTILYYMIL